MKKGGYKSGSDSLASQFQTNAPGFINKHADSAFEKMLGKRGKGMSKAAGNGYRQYTPTNSYKGC